MHKMGSSRWGKKLRQGISANLLCSGKPPTKLCHEAAEILIAVRPVQGRVVLQNLAKLLHLVQFELRPPERLRCGCFKCSPQEFEFPADVGERVTGERIVRQVGCQTNAGQQLSPSPPQCWQ